MNDYALVQDIDPEPVEEKTVAVVDEIRRIGNDCRMPAFDEMFLKHSKLTPGRHAAPIDDCDLRLFYFSAPLPVRLQQRIQKCSMRLRQPMRMAREKRSH